jgi:putative RNA 2'-phosphotransferase
LPLPFFEADRRRVLAFDRLPFAFEPLRLAVFVAIENLPVHLVPYPDGGRPHTAGCDRSLAAESAGPMDKKRLVKVSKYLSRHLRHSPERLGITLEPGGWVRIDVLLRACALRSFQLTEDELREVVERNDKQRFSFDEEGLRIRANQGHSVPIDLELSPTQPPDVLFHGTASHNLDSIFHAGLQRRGRHHVHLSLDEATAERVGSRHGRAVVLRVDARRMAADGHAFFVTPNNVWLAAEVPADYLQLMHSAGEPREPRTSTPPNAKRQE